MVQRRGFIGSALSFGALGRMGGFVVGCLAYVSNAETIPFDDGWEFAMKDYWLSYGKVGLAAPDTGTNDNGIPRVRADAEGWGDVTLPHDWVLSLPYSNQDVRNGYHAVGRSYRVSCSSVAVAASSHTGTLAAVLALVSPLAMMVRNPLSTLEDCAISKWICRETPCVERLFLLGSSTLREMPNDGCVFR